MSDEPTAQPPRKRAPAKKAAKKAAPRLASADTPAARRARDDAMGLPADEIEIVPPRPDAPRYGRRVPEGQVPALIASAAKIDLNDRNSLQHLRKRRQQWQTEAWDYFDEVGEIGYVITFIGNLLSKIRLYPAVRPDPKEAPIAVDDEGSGVDPTTAKIAIATLERLHSSQGGQSAIIRELAINFEVAGEAYLHGHEDPDTAEEDWQVRSVDELLVTGDQFALRTAPGAMQGEAVPKDDLVIRLWERHPRFSEIATCALRRVLGEAESLLLLSREIRATSKSRLTAGILLVPSELSFGSNDPTRDSADGEVTDDPFDEELQTAMITPIQEEGSAAAVVPLVLRGPAEFLKEVRHLILEKKLDAVLDARIEGRVMRIGRGLNMPVEVTTGLQETTFANAAQVKKSEWDSHGEPRAVLIVDALTAGYYQAALVEAGITIEKARDIFVWFDPTEAIAAPDPTDNAEKAHEDGVISDEARRRVSGFSESDAPTDEELIRRILLRGVRLDPFIQAQLLKSTGLAPDIDIPAPSSGVYGEAAPTPAAVVAASRLVELAAGRRPPLGVVLVGIDRDVRTRVAIGADAAMRRTLERAGNRLASKLRRSRSFASEATAMTPPRDMAAALGPAMLRAAGIEDDDLLSGAFEDFGADFLSLVGKAQADARRAVEKYFGPLPTPAEKALFAQQQAARDRAWSVMYGRLRDEAGIRLFSPVPSFAGPGEVDPNLTIPGAIIRQAMALAGGAQAQEERGAVTDTHGTPVGGVATGPDLMAAVGEVGGAVEAYEWDYGTAPRLHPFEPHELLDGVQFTNFDDPVLANDEGWPETDFFYPGDHSGCVCDIVPILVDSTTGETTVDLGD